MKRKYILIAILIIVIGLIVIKLGSNKKAINEKNKPSGDSLVAIPVKVARAVRKLQSFELTKTGTVAPYVEAKIFATISGTVHDLRFALGSRVTQGQVLAVLDQRTLHLELRKAESNAAKLKQDLATYSELLAGQAATADKVNGLRHDYQDALNQVEQARKQVSDAFVRAPTSGIVAAKLIEQGTFISAGGHIATIINLKEAKITLDLTEEEVYQAKEGQPVTISAVVYEGKDFKGKITFISPQADEAHNYHVEIIARPHGDSQLRSGTLVKVTLSAQEKQDMLVIPREALIESIKDPSVYVVQNNMVQQRTIQTGGESGRMIIIKNGLQPGEVVVTAGQINLKNGAHINISK